MGSEKDGQGVTCRDGCSYIQGVVEVANDEVKKLVGKGQQVGHGLEDATSG